MAENIPEIPTTLDFLDEVRALILKENPGLDVVSNNRLAKRLGWDSARLRNYIHGRSTLDEEGCKVIAQVLDYPVETVLACVYLERSKKRDPDDSVTHAWERICQRVAIPAVCFLVGFSSVFPFPL